AIGFDWRYYETNVFNYGKDPSSFSAIDDSITLSNGIPWIEHAITTSTSDSNEFRSITDRTVTAPDGKSVETITTTTDDYSSDHSRYLMEVRDLGGNLIYWSLSAWTNDPLHSQQVILLESGGNDESSPFFVERDTNTLDPLGN